MRRKKKKSPRKKPSPKVCALSQTFLQLPCQDQPAEESLPQDPGKASKVRKRKGGGGAWRAYQHVHAKGRKLSPSLVRQLSQAYAQLSDTEYEYFASLGRQATEAHQVGAVTFPHSIWQRACCQTKGPPPTFLCAEILE